MSETFAAPIPPLYYERLRCNAMFALQCNVCVAMQCVFRIEYPSSHLFLYWQQPRILTIHPSASWRHPFLLPITAGILHYNEVFFPPYPTGINPINVIQSYLLPPFHSPPKLTLLSYPRRTRNCIKIVQRTCKFY